MSSANDKPAATASSGERPGRIALLALDLAAIAAAVVIGLVLRSGFRAVDPLSLDRLIETTKATIAVYLVSVPLMLAVCGRYSRRSDALELRRTATGVLLSAAVISAWSIHGDQPWWLFMPVLGSLATVAALTVSGHVAGMLARRRR